MIHSVEELRDALSGTGLAEREISKLPILDTGEHAFAMELEVPELASAWSAARGLVGRTERWPVVISTWDEDAGTWSDRLLASDPFSRFHFEEGAPGADVSPRAILARADQVDVDEFLARLADERAASEDLEDAAGWELAETERAVGSRPTWEACYGATVFGRPVGCVHDLDRYLLDWELAHAGGVPSTGITEWFVPSDATLLLLPIAKSWDALAYLHWYASSGRPAELDIALGREWQRRYGAEIVTHFGTMLGCRVTRRPDSVDEAWQLAREHDLAAPYTLLGPGERVRRYALELRNSERWQLHERP
ncbi:MAG: DUF4253 domain-containing protein [Planctomycetes bacterium]|nr:DUF4253 domain-containing protein [Planctomycetota bacterium]